MRRLFKPIRSPAEPAGLYDNVSIHGRYVAPVLFTLSILASAALLFFVQPLLTRMVTPLAGGAPGVWTTASLFFQTVMIGGYLYAHLLTRLPRIRHQIGIHLMLWLGATSFLPMALPEAWSTDTEASIQTQTLALYAVTIGLPFLFLSANAPLIQTWYGRTRGPSSHDPYFLYGASNVGSLIALIGFPLIAEPFFMVTEVSMAWSIAFLALGALLFISAFLTTRDHPDAKTVLPITDKSSDLSTLWAWGVVAFVPSSLMLALTTKVTTDFGSFPLMWVIPLALYLVSYILGFWRTALISDQTMEWLYPLALSLLTLLGMTTILGALTLEAAGIMALAFLVVSYHLHRRLYRMRPDPSRLTVFYLTIAIGGALGGFFNAIVAPGLMDGMHEFPLSLLAACGVALIGYKHPAPKKAQLPFSGVLVAVLMVLFALDTGKIISSGLDVQLIFAPIAILSCCMLSRVELQRAGVFGFCFATAVAITVGGDANTIYQERNFFGHHRVIEGSKLRVYLNGTTVHGGQEVHVTGTPEPLYYYRRNGPLGEIGASDLWQDAERIGLVGLGIGSMSAYVSPETELSAYEIDPSVIEIATDPSLFTFMSSYAPQARIHLGDARILLEKQKAQNFDALLIDAYSSDSVPMHLSTVEAMEAFMDDVAQDGILIYHISNRYFDLAPPLAAAARELGLMTWQREDWPEKNASIAHSAPVVALVVTRKGQAPDFLKARDASGELRWKPITEPSSRAWRDEIASPFSALK